MHLNSERAAVSFLLKPLVVAVLLLYLTGCASKPWTGPLGSEQADETALLVDALAARDRACGTSLEGDIILFYKTPFDKKGVNGLLQVSLPFSYKFVMTNPFGQPLLAIAGDKQSYQVINTLDRRYLAGSIRSFGVKNNIAAPILQGNWGDWLMGRNSFSGRQITEIRRDRIKRGVWVSFAPQEKSESGAEHLLIDPERQLYLARIIEDMEKKVIAEITYEGWAAAGECSQPLDISIIGLDYGAEIHLKLSNIAVTNEQEVYRLPIPPGYIRQFMP